MWGANRRGQSDPEGDSRVNPFVSIPRILNLDRGPGTPSLLRFTQGTSSVTPSGGEWPPLVGSLQRNEGPAASSMSEAAELAPPPGMTQVPQQERRIDEDGELKRDG